jgi:hypothetical protein
MYLLSSAGDSNTLGKYAHSANRHAFVERCLVLMSRAFGIADKDKLVVANLNSYQHCVDLTRVALLVAVSIQWPSRVDVCWKVSTEQLTYRQSAAQADGSGFLQDWDAVRHPW